MRNRKLTLLLAMLVLAIFAVGAVSAEDNVTDIDVPTEDTAIDEVAVDDDSAGETDEIEETQQTRTITYTQFNITTSSNFTDINAKIADGTYDGYEFVFDSTNGTYTNFAMVTGNNNKFTGNGAIINGSTDNLFTVAGSNNIVITGFNMNVATGQAALDGANVFNAEITNNNISGGKDGINIMQTHDNITISGNTITGFTRDGISLVDHRTLNDTEWANRGNSVISNNVITGISIASTEVGMFFGGNFKGTITGNNITDCYYGMQFSGKKLASNGRLNAVISYNRIIGSQVGIDMNNPGVDYLNIHHNTISTANNTGYVITNNTNFNKTVNAKIYVRYNTFYGFINRSFLNQTTVYTPNYGNFTINENQ